MFRFKSGVNVDYNRQGYIYFVSRLFKELPQAEKQKILNLCMLCGGEYYQALFEFVTTDVTATALCMKYYISRATLYRAVRKYYEEFQQNLNLI